MWKRIFDFVATPIAGFVLLPLFLFIVISVALTSPGPVLFTQWRAGVMGRKFRIYKFRTLIKESDPENRDVSHLNEREGPAFKVELDPRATKLGHWLRVSGLDELPQLWNIWLGDMSWVGPRPLPCHEIEACSEWQKLRLKARPGLTCLWQIRQQEVSFDEWMRMDLRYVENMSPWLDFKILCATPLILVRRVFQAFLRR